MKGASSTQYSQASADIELLYRTRARRSDAVLIAPGMVGRDGVPTYHGSKTGNQAYISWTCSRPPHAHEADRQQMHRALAAVSTGHLTRLAARAGRTRSFNAVGNVIAAAAAGFGRSAHGLRKPRAITRAESGANPLEIRAGTSHRSLSDVAHYMAKADRKRLVRGTEQDQNLANPRKPAGKVLAPS
ncbi:hypothetical protein [Xinfangfangia pollutisoli]|uniref:hypothetical protein n=1 Tax=Xinfangfangia pollutisoli TaxID=2865960 RepID=UPI001CD3CD3F|nr:hypothetical protein [Xinfangfangia pollutisoli]